MYNSSKEKFNIIYKLYSEGKLLNEIATLTTSSTITVKKALLQMGIDYEKLTSEEFDKAFTEDAVQAIADSITF